MSGKIIGKVTHFYNQIGVVVVVLSGAIELGDQVHFLGRHTDFQQQIHSMQIDHQSMPAAEKGQEIAIKVEQRVRNHDKVYKLIDDE